MFKSTRYVAMFTFTHTEFSVYLVVLKSLLTILSRLDRRFLKPSLEKDRHFELQKQ